MCKRPYPLYTTGSGCRVPQASFNIWSAFKKNYVLYNVLLWTIQTKVARQYVKTPCSQPPLAPIVRTGLEVGLLLHFRLCSRNKRLPCMEGRNNGHAINWPMFKHPKHIMKTTRVMLWPELGDAFARDGHQATFKRNGANVVHERSTFLSVTLTANAWF